MLFNAKFETSSMSVRILRRLYKEYNICRRKIKVSKVWSQREEQTKIEVFGKRKEMIEKA
jgi:hypothetical protein